MIRLAVRVRREQAELVLAELLSFAPGGVEEVSQGPLVEYAVYGPPGELPSLPDLQAAVGDALVEVTTSQIADDWSERWREFHVPLVLDGALTVRPPWEAPRGEPGVDVVIDPGQAFGTGAHATTRLCLELMLSLDPGGGFVDLGCGSGVLAITAAKLGWAPVIALDNDPSALEATRENARVNEVEVEVRRVDLRVDEVPSAGTVAANLLAPLLLGWARRLGSDPPARVIAGGLLVGEGDRVADAFAARGMRESARRESGDWAALLMMRDGPG
jgi:ribosomal protein L11 methyltransferase